MRTALPAVALAAVLAATSARGQARTIDGHVFVDVDGDGVLGEADDTLPGVYVAFDSQPFARTDESGRYAIDAPSSGGIVWVRIPDGYAPNPSFAAIPATVDVTADLALVPRAAQTPFTFVIAADSHVGKQEYGGQGTLDAAALGLSLDQALGFHPPPHFFVIAGDITNRAKKSEMQEALRAIAATTVPFVPIPGNHDWLGEGNNYRKYFGPPNYSFDAGGVHFVVLNDNPKQYPDFAFLTRDLALVRDDRLVVAFVHRPPEHNALERLSALGIDYLFTGHWHSNRYAYHDELVQVNTESIVRGGLDFTPAGYRIVSVQGRELSITHHTVVEKPVVAITWPAEQCSVAGPLRILAAVETGAARVEVTASVDFHRKTMEHAGGWTYSVEFGPLEPGDHFVFVTVEDATGLIGSAHRVFASCEELPPPRLADWLQAHGGPEHRGVAPATIAPPLRTLWVVAVGGHLQGGSPVVAAGRLYVSLLDLDDGQGGGVVALDARTGAQLWRYVTGHSVRNAPAVAGNLVVIAANDGVLHAVDAATGDLRWQYDLGAGLDDNRSALLAAPTIHDGVVYVGVLGHFAALDLATGTHRWSNEPAPTMYNHASYGAATISDGVVIAVFGLGGDGVIAWDAATGRERWRLGKQVSAGVHAAPVVHGDTVYIANSSTELSAISIADGSLQWQHKVHASGTPLSMAIAGTPATYRNLLIIPTQYESVVGVDLEDRKTVWTVRTRESNVHVAHNKRLARSVPGSPVVTGDIVWIAGADGVLRAINATTGHERWTTDLGIPILSAAAPAGEVLFVSTYDGTVRAMVHDPRRPAPSASSAPSRAVRWMAGLGAGALALAVATWLFVRTGRRRRAVQSRGS